MNFDPSTQKSQKLNFNGLLLTKMYNVWVKKAQRNYVWWHWILMQNLKKKSLILFPKITWGIWQIFTRAPESLKIGNLIGSFIQSRKCISLKLTREFYIMTMKNNGNFEGPLTCHFKIDMTNLTNFDPSTQKSQNFALSWAAFDQSM